MRSFTFTQGQNNAAKVRDSFQEATTRKTAEHTVKHRNGGVGSMVANHRGGGKKFGGCNNTSAATCLS